MRWTDFRPLGVPKFTPSDFAETLDGGQSFRWYADANSDAPQFTGAFGNTAAKLRLDGAGEVLYSVPENANPDAARKIAEYLDADRDYAALRQSLFDTADAHMRAALRIYPTLRILRQPPAEALMCFICSSSKRIVQIKQCVKLLSENFGEEIADGIRALPSFEKIADADISKIRKCKLGFRAEYLKKSAQKIVADSFDPNGLREMPYREAKKYLTSLSGIGEKVADCILLFGAAKMDAFPVDTWIRKAISELYGTPDNPDKIREFAAQKFGAHAGFAQQLIFAAKRKNLL